MTAATAATEPGSAMEFDRTFSPEPRSALAARRFVRSRLGEQGVSSEDSELVVSELMGNVVRHAQTPVTVRLGVGQTVRVEVHDGNAIIPAVAEAAEDAEAGRGLFIISNVAMNWGVDQTPDGKCVWVELTREAD